MWRRRRSDEDFGSEIRAHIELETDRLIGEGLSPADARTAAVRQFGNVASAQERFYESRRVLWLDQSGQDLRYAWRMLKKNSSFALVAILTLALGIGANTAIFSVVKAVLLEPLPYPDAGRLVHMIQNLAASQTIDARPRRIVAMDLREFLELQSRTQTLAQVAAYDTRREVTLSGRDEPLRIVGTPISASLIPMLGVQPMLGRSFTADEARPGSPQAVVLSYGGWRKYFAADPNLVQRTVILDGRGYTVAGIMPPGFEFPDAASEFWVPLDLTPPAGGDIRSLIPIGRLKEGVAAEAAAGEANNIIGQLRQTYSPDRVAGPAALEIVSIKDELVRSVRSALKVLMVAVAFVLLIACSNVANLLLARGAARQGEHAIRSALGAGRGRLIRQTLTESCLLGVCGGIAGFVVALGGVDLLRNLASDYLPRLSGIVLDVPVLVFTLALSVLTSVLFGLLPALQLSRVSHMEVIKASSPMKSSRRHLTRGSIVIAETAMAVVLR